MQLMYRTFSVNGVVIATTFVPMKPNPQANGAAVVKLDGLTPSTAYEYEIRINNEVVAEGRFRTAPPPNQPTPIQTYDNILSLDIKQNIIELFAN